MVVFSENKLCKSITVEFTIRVKLKELVQYFLGLRPSRITECGRTVSMVLDHAYKIKVW